MQPITARCIDAVHRLGVALRDRWWRYHAVRRLQTLGHPTLRALAAHDRPDRLWPPQYETHEWARLTTADYRAIVRLSQPRLITDCPEFWAVVLDHTRQAPALWPVLWRWQAEASPFAVRPTHEQPSRERALTQSVERVLERLSEEAAPEPVSRQSERLDVLQDLLEYLPVAHQPVWPPLRIKPLLRHPDRDVRELGLRLLASHAAPPRGSETSSPPPAV